MDAGGKEALAGVDVANADYHVAGEQYRFDGSPGPARRLVQHFGVESRIEGFDPEARQQRVGADIAVTSGVPEQGTKAPRVMKSCDRRADEQFDMIMHQASRRCRAFQHPPGARHAKVGNHRAMLEAPQQVLAAPTNAFERAPGQGGAKIPRHRPAQARLQYGYPAYGMSGEAGVQRAGSDFDFRKFGHDFLTFCGRAGAVPGIICGFDRLPVPFAMSTPFPFRPVLRRRACVLSSAVLASALAACSTVPHAPAAQAGAAPVAEAVAPALPAIDLSPELLFRIVVAEIAVQRGELGPAYGEYMHVAQQTRDPRMAHRALEIAVMGRAITQGLEAAALWHQLDPTDASAAQSYAGMLISAGRFDQAEPLLHDQLEHAANPAETLAELQHATAQSQDPARAYRLIADLSVALLARADTAYDVQVILARAAQAAGDSGRALFHVREAVRLRPDAEPAVIALSQLLTEQDSQAGASPAGKGRAEAIATLETFLQAHPDARDVRTMYARLLVGAGRLDQAQAQFEEVLKRNPDNPEPLFSLGILELDSEHYDEAHSHFDRYLAAVGPQPGHDLDLVYVNVARACEGQHRYQEALDWLHKVNKGGEQAGQSREREAFVLVHMKRTDDALNLLRDLPGNTPDQKLQRVLLLGQVLREAHRYQDSFDVLSQALAGSPNDGSLLYETAMSAERIDRIDIMETHLRRLVTLHPDYAHAYNALGFTFADRNVRLPEAFDLIDHALQLSPDDGFIVDSMGWVQFRMGKLGQARSLLTRAFHLKADPDVAAHLGEVMWAQGEHDAARTLLIEARRRDGESDTLRDTLKRLSIESD